MTPRHRNRGRERRPAPQAGRREFDSPRRAILGLVLVAAVVAFTALFLLRPRTSALGPGDQPAEPWNVLLVSLDTTRPDYLSGALPDGRSAPVPTPALERVRGGGFVFSSMISPTPITLPSHASLLTGTNPYRHGVRENTEYALPEAAVSLAELLADRGYRTQAFVSAFVMDARFGLAQGFSGYVDDLAAPGLPAGTAEIPGGVTAGRAAEFIAAHAEARRTGRESRPFFLFVHFFDAHAPYAPPSPYRERHASDPYAGEIAYQDACLGIVLDRLEAAGEARRTLVWVVSDHGESLGAHGEDTHSLFIYDVTQRAVSVLRLPPSDSRFLRGDPRLVVSDATGLVDVAPTLLDVLGLPVPAGLDGSSTRSLLEGGVDSDRFVYCETYSPYIAYRWSPLVGVRSATWKYIRAPHPELYDLVADPGEERNLAAARPEVVAEATAALEGFLAETETKTVGTDANSARSGAEGTDLDAARREASEEERARLRSLGYLAGSSTAGRPPTDADLPDPKRQIAFFRQTFQTAKSLLLAGRAEEAVSGFEEARRVDPGNPSIHQFLGVAYRQTSRFDEAAGAYREALSLQPDSPRSWVGLGRAQLSRGLPDSARLAFARARDLLPSSPDAWEGLGDVAWTEGNLPRAAALLDSARVLGMPPVIIEGKLARLYRDGLRDPDRARLHLEAFARALGTDPSAAEGRLPPSPQR